MSNTIIEFYNDMSTQMDCVYSVGSYKLNILF